MFSSLNETIMLLFNMPIAPPRPKRNAMDIPLVELSRGRRADRRLSEHDSADGLILAVRHFIFSIQW